MGILEESQFALFVEWLVFSPTARLEVGERGHRLKSVLPGKLAHFNAYLGWRSESQLL